MRLACCIHCIILRVLVEYCTGFGKKLYNIILIVKGGLDE